MWLNARSECGEIVSCDCRIVLFWNGNRQDSIVNRVRVNVVEYERKGRTRMKAYFM